MLHNNKTYRFATYNRSKLQLIDFTDDKIKIVLHNRNYRLEVEIDRRKSGELVAPLKGEMVRMIKESVDSLVRVTLKDNAGKEIFSGAGRRAGLEVTSNIYSLLEGKVIG